MGLTSYAPAIITRREWLLPPKLSPEYKHMEKAKTQLIVSSEVQPDPYWSRARQRSPASIQATPSHLAGTWEIPIFLYSTHIPWWDAMLMSLKNISLCWPLLFSPAPTAYSTSLIGQTCPVQHWSLDILPQSCLSLFFSTSYWHCTLLVILSSPHPEKIKGQQQKPWNQLFTFSHSLLFIFQ